MQGSFTARKIYIQTLTVLHQVIEALQTFISNIKEAVPISAESSIMFVKKGAKVPRKRIPPVGILHYASDWVLLADLNSNYCFPVHIAFTQLRPDIAIFSNSLRKVILIEQSPFRIKYSIAYVTSYQSQHGCEKEFNQTC